MKPLRHYLPLAITFAIGILVSFILFAIVNKWENEKQRIEFESRAARYAHIVQHTIHDYVESLNYIGDFFNNSEQVTREEFSSFVLHAIARHPGIQAFSWNPLIRNSERAYYESLAREDGFENFMFTEHADDQKLVRAGQREEYVIVYYIEPLETNKPAFGYDIASNPIRLKAINKSFDTGNLSATERITLVQETEEQYGVLLLLPLYERKVSLKTTEDRRKHRKGFVVEVLHISDIMEDAMKHISNQRIDMYLYDLSADETNQFLFFRPSHTPGITTQPQKIDDIQKGLYWSTEFDLADRQWQLLFSPSSFYLKSRTSWQPWFVLTGSLLLTFMLASYISRTSKYTANVKKQLHKNKLILETTMEGFILVDTLGNIVDVNSSYCGMSGYTREELLKKNLREIDLLLSSEEVEHLIKKMVEQGRDHFETKHKCKNGSIIDLDVSVSIMKLEETHFVAAFIRNISDRKRIMREYELERKKAQQYLDTVETIIVSLDKEGAITMINRKGFELLGYKGDEMIGKNWFKIFLPQPEGLDHVYPYFKQLIAGKVKSKEYFENYIVLRDGTQRLIAWHNVLLRNEEGHIIGTLSSGDDITERRKAEEALMESEYRFRSVVESSPMGMHMYHLESENSLVFTGFNNAADQILGVDNSQFIGRTIEEAFPPLSATEIPERYRRAAGQGESWMAEQISYEDEQISGAFQVHVFQTQPNKMVAMFLDITEKKKVENRLEESERRYRNITDHSSFGISTYDESGNCVVANKATADIIGATVEQVIAQNFYTIKSWQESGMLDSALDALESGRKIAKTFHVISSFGRDVWIDCTFVPYYEKRKKFLLVITEDVTRSKNAEEAQKQLTEELIIKNRELEQVLYVTSHDLRSPLVNVEGYSRELAHSLDELMSLIEHEPDLSGIKEKIEPLIKKDIPGSLHYIQASVLKMETLIKGILKLSRLGRSEQKIEQIDMNEMMTGIIDTHRFRLDKLNIKTEVSDLPECRGDSAQINQVFSNLLDNAIKYSDAERSGIIQISGHRDGNQSVYCVEDNGIGIAPEHQDRIFEIFQQLAPREIKGEGMGLTIAQRIIEKHHGRIWVESEPGKGSRFYVSLPGE